MAPTLATACAALPPAGAQLAWGGPALRSMAPTLFASRTALLPEGAACRGSKPANAGLDGMQRGCISQSGGLQGLRLRPGEAGSAALAGAEGVITRLSGWLALL
jgi:hypothetical protein